MIGKVPTCEVVPERTPLVVLKLKPVGSAPLSEKVTVPCPPACVNCSVKATPAVPVLFAGLVTVITGQVMVSVYAVVLLSPVQPLPSVTLTVIGHERTWVR